MGLAQSYHELLWVRAVNGVGVGIGEKAIGGAGGHLDTLGVFLHPHSNSVYGVF